jgi:hypothetical protein
MIIFFEHGKLGNQLFQYFGLKNFFPEQKLYFFGFSDLQNLFDNIDLVFIKIETNSFFIRVLKKTLLFLCVIRILGKIKEIDTNEKSELNVRQGLFWNIYLSDNIYFQKNNCIKKIINPPVIKKKYLKIAENWLKKKKIFHRKLNLVFVNVRRGDYLKWPHPNSTALLNLSWYNKQMLIIKKKIKKPIFIMMGDDTEYLCDVFKESKKLIISKNSREVDLSIMSFCSHGILSASTFAWWGAFYAKTYSKIHNYFIAPKYWAGHKRKKWFPKNFYCDWIIYKT